MQLVTMKQITESYYQQNHEVTQNNDFQHSPISLTLPSHIQNIHTGYSMFPQ